MVFWKKKHWEDEYDEYYTRDIERGGSGPPRWAFVPHALGMLLIGGIFIGAVGVVSGVKMMQYLLTSLAMPVGLLWLALIVLVYFCLLRKQSWPALVSIGCWILLTLAGNSLVTKWLADSIEAPYHAIDSLAGESFDLVVVLGGGTGTRNSGQPQGTHAGDRILTAAQIYHAGKAEKLMCTGIQEYRSTDKDLHPNEEAARLLADLDVPGESILRIKGSNTSEEMANLKTFLESNPNYQRVGLVTSAWHMSRALRLAKANGLELDPVPANFLGQPFAPAPDVVVPSGNNLATTSLIIKEHLARLFGR